MAVLEKIVFKDFSVEGTCDLFHYGVTYDCLFGWLSHFEIYAGTLNGIVGEFGTGGAILSYILSNNRKFYEGKIYIDDKKEMLSSIVKNSWYIGYDIYGSHRPLWRKTIKEQIADGVQLSYIDLNVDAIQDMFEISEVGAKKSIQKAGFERWKASIAIGFAYGKKIFCYPWMNSKDIESLKEQMTQSIKVLIDNNCIVILPTTKEKNITQLSSKYHIVNVEYVKQY